MTDKSITDGLFISVWDQVQCKQLKIALKRIQNRNTRWWRPLSLPHTHSNQGPWSGFRDAQNLLDRSEWLWPEPCSLCSLVLFSVVLCSEVLFYEMLISEVQFFAEFFSEVLCKSVFLYTAGPYFVRLWCIEQCYSKILLTLFQARLTPS